ncbi:MAG TPA: ATP-binding cassette domain-containing protein [Rhizomicrobium sp.]|jgi:ABC-2 type transport system ATP-binding protein|nr:ATP-binding cassette domain-containing protein [Rhizomicrobium sp.]
MTGNAVDVFSLRKTFGSFVAVDDVSFAVPAGQIVAFLGANGAGKTTTLRMILDIIKPDRGRIAVFGEAVAPLHRIGYLPEERGLYRRMRAEDVIAYFAALKGLTLVDGKARARALLARFGLAEFARYRIEALSKGMAQKIGLMTALVHDPDLLILDEPFSGLDPLNQSGLEAELRAEVSRGKSVIFSTHTLPHAERLADRVIIMDKGRMLFDGSREDALKLLPPRVRLAADSDLGFLAIIGGVRKASPPVAERPFWELELQDRAVARAVLAACFERNVIPTRFETADATLHDVFIALVGPSAP